MINLTSENFKREVEEYQGLVVIDIWASWCGPCMMLAPVIDELSVEYPDVKFCKINVDEERALALSFKVESIPTVAFVKDNTFIDVSVGFVPKAKLAKMIEEHK